MNKRVHFTIVYSKLDDYEERDVYLEELEWCTFLGELRKNKLFIFPLRNEKSANFLHIKSSGIKSIKNIRVEEASNDKPTN